MCLVSQVIISYALILLLFSIRDMVLLGMMKTFFFSQSSEDFLYSLFVLKVSLRANRRNKQV